MSFLSSPLTAIKYSDIVSCNCITEAGLIQLICQIANFGLLISLKLDFYKYVLLSTFKSSFRTAKITDKTRPKLQKMLSLTRQKHSSTLKAFEINTESPDMKEAGRCPIF